MAKLSYEEFKKEVVDNIKSYLTDEYRDYDMKFTIIQKIGYEYEALMIIGEEHTAPALNMIEAYTAYLEGVSLDTILSKLADIRMSIEIPEFNKKDIFSFGKIRNRILPRLINTKTNEEYLKDKPHKEVEDLSIVYVVRLSENLNGISDAIISNRLVELWEVDDQELQKAAIENISKINSIFMNIATFEELSIKDIEFNNFDIPFFILTNHQKTYGAAMILDSTFMDKIVDKFGEIYILPSSIDEVIIIPQSVIDEKDKSGLKEMVRNINGSELKPEQVLSDNIYTYDLDQHSIKLVV